MQTIAHKLGETELQDQMNIVANVDFVEVWTVCSCDQHL